MRAFFERLSAVLFLPLRWLAGPLHRRRRIPKVARSPEDDRLPPLPEPWRGDARWYRGDFPPRRHNHIRALPEGDAFFPDLVQSLREAQQRVTICGWCLTPHMSLLRGEAEAESILCDVLHDVSTRADVYVLLWAGAPALFQPTQRMVKNARQRLLKRAPLVRCELDYRAKFSHDHHQKAITIDSRVAYVGGMDLTTFQGDRWDTDQHQLRFGPNWHDVQLRLEGEIVRDVEENFCERWNSATGDRMRLTPPPAVDPAWDTPAQVIRTVPVGFYPFAPRGIYGIRHALVEAIERAERFIYLENQYIWAPEIVDALMVAMNRRHPNPFRIVTLLPAKALSGRYDNDQHVRTLMKEDAGRGIFHPYTVYTAGPASSVTGHSYQPIYVHAKVAIVDDQWLSVGSANLNRRGLATDTEMNVQTVAPEIARELRIALWSEHLGVPPDAIAEAEPVRVIDTLWREKAGKLESCWRAGEPPPGGHIVAYKPGGGPASHLLDWVQDWTLEY